MVARNVAAIMRSVLLMVHGEGRLKLLLKAFILSCGRGDSLHSAHTNCLAMTVVDSLLVVQLLSQVFRLHRAICSPV